MESPPQKRIKTQLTEEEDGEEDRISSLPDCLILEILSHLDSTKYAIRTGTLSKRWQHLWPSLPCLSFDQTDFVAFSNPYNPLPDFYLAVNKTLNQCQSKNIIKFKVSAAYDKRFESHVGNWIHFVTSSNVQKLTLNFKHLYYYVNEGFVLKDESFLINSHFTRLHLDGCLFNPTGPISWNNLTQLTVSHLKLDQDSITNILSGTPLLDTLSLVDCGGFSWLNITSKNVKSLVVDGYRALEYNIVVEINAPYISSLTIKGNLWLCKLLLQDVSSLVKADLDFTMFGDYVKFPEKDEDEMLNRFILNLRHIKELKIGLSCYKVLARLEVRGFIFPSNLKVLYSSAYSRALVDCRDSYSSESDASDRSTFQAEIQSNQCLERLID